jgi:hypothetical protein
MSRSAREEFSVGDTVQFIADRDNPETEAENFIVLGVEHFERLSVEYEGESLSYRPFSVVNVTSGDGVVVSAFDVDVVKVDSNDDDR